MVDVRGRDAGRKDAGRGQGIGQEPRGRPRGSGGGRRGGRGGAQVPQVTHESDDEAEIQVEDLRANGLNTNPFPGAIEDDEENEENEALLLSKKVSLENYLSYKPQKHLAMRNIASMAEILFLDPTMRRLRSTDSLIILLFNWCFTSPKTFLTYFWSAQMKFPAPKSL